MVIARPIALDASILLRALFDRRIIELIIRYGTEVSFAAPAIAFAEVRRGIPVLSKRNKDLPNMSRCFEELGTLVGEVPMDLLTPHKQSSIARTGVRYSIGWPMVACALVLECPIWTEDQDLFGIGIPTWTTDRVSIYLRGDSRGTTFPA